MRCFVRMLISEPATDYPVLLVYSVFFFRLVHVLCRGINMAVGCCAQGPIRIYPTVQQGWWEKKPMSNNRINTGQGRRDRQHNKQ